VWENVEFTPTGAAYQEAHMVYATSEDAALGNAYRRDRGFMQVTLFYPLNTGATAASDKADALISWFKRGSVVTNGGQSVRILNTPTKTILGSDGQFFKIAVSIYFNAEVFG
jgi:hypothetical protein